MNLQEFLRTYTEMKHPLAIAEAAEFASAALPAPDDAVNLAYAMQQLDDLAGARELCKRLTRARPDFAPGWARLGQVELDLGETELALRHASKASEVNPDCSFSRLCLGIVLRAVGQVTSATRQFTVALNLAPENPIAWSHYGLSLSDQFQHEMAGAALQKAIDLDPGSSFHWSNRLLSEHYYPGLNSKQLISSASGFARSLGESHQRMAHSQSEVIHVAYLGPDLYNHPVGRLILPILKAHDQQRFKLTVLRDGPRADPVTEEIAATASQFIDTCGLDDSALARLVIDEQIDVLVDLAGHTAGNRLPAFARRLAPVQVSWLGYVGTTGLANMDAVILGERHCTDSTQQFFVEPVVTVPGTHFVYQPPDYLPPLKPVTADHLRFACFNNTAKLNTEVLACWCEILRQLPGATLTLRWKTLADPQFAGHVRSRFANLGLAPERLSLLPHCDHATLLASYNEVDIALDPFPFGGGITTFEALSMGVPVVTMAWQRPSSRQGAAVLQQIGLDNLVAANASQYGQLAVALARDGARRQQLRQQLRAAIMSHLEKHARVVAAGLESIYSELLAAD